MEISIIVPVFNSEKILPILVKEIDKIFSLKKNTFEVFLINDNSKDSSWNTIKDLTKKFDFVKGINLLNNYGQHNAIMAGLKNCSGEYIVLMDDDMQHPPSYIPSICAELKNNFDVCYVKYLNRKHFFWKRAVSWLNNIVASILALKPIKIYTSSYKGFNKKICSNIIAYNGSEVFLDWLILEKANKIAVIEIEHSQRLSGSTNYGLKRLFFLWSVMILKIIPKNKIHKIVLIMPKIIVRYCVYNLIKKNNTKEQFKISEKTF